MPGLTDRPNYRMPWSSNDVAKLKTMISSGKTMSEAAVALGRSQEAVRNKARVLGLLPDKPSYPVSRNARARPSILDFLS